MRVRPWNKLVKTRLREEGKLRMNVGKEDAVFSKATSSIHKARL